MPAHSLRTTMVVAAFVVAMSARAMAQQNNANKTGLPLYPHATTGTQYPEAEDPDGRWYLIYTAASRDSLARVEGWYRRALPNATETSSTDALTHGIQLAIGKDRVLIYQLGTGRGVAIELHKYVRG